MFVQIKKRTPGHYIITRGRIVVGAIDKLPGGAWAAHARDTGHIEGKGLEFRSFKATSDLAREHFGNRDFCHGGCGLVMPIHNLIRGNCPACAAELGVRI